MNEWIKEGRENHDIQNPHTENPIRRILIYGIAILIKKECSNPDIPIESTTSYNFLTQLLIGLKIQQEPNQDQSCYDLDYILSILRKTGSDRLSSKILLRIIYLTPYFNSVTDPNKVFIIVIIVMLFSERFYRSLPES